MLDVDMQRDASSQRTDESVRLDLFAWREGRALDQAKTQPDLDQRNLLLVRVKVKFSL